jgi:hypothetical protein
MYPFVVRKPHTTRGFVGALRRVRISGDVQRLPRLGHRSAARSCTSEPLRARKRAALNGVARTRVLPTPEAVLCRFRFSAKGWLDRTHRLPASQASKIRQRSGARRRTGPGIRVNSSVPCQRPRCQPWPSRGGVMNFLRRCARMRPRAEPATVRISRPIKRNRPRQYAEAGRRCGQPRRRAGSQPVPASNASARSAISAFLRFAILSAA